MRMVTALSSKHAVLQSEHQTPTEPDTSSASDTSTANYERVKYDESVLKMVGALSKTSN